MNAIKNRLKILYPQQYEAVYQDIMDLLNKWSKRKFPSYPWVDQQDVLMIAYGDSIQSDTQMPLQALRSFADRHLKGTLSAIHLLPMYPFTSDDGFSVTDFRQINPDFGTWEDIKQLGQDYDLMFDAVINHVSKSSKYFQGFLECSPEYANFFIDADPGKDYSMVTRPRALPLLTAFDTKCGIKHVWTTFSEDQVDLNFKEPKVLLEVLDILLLYASKGARFIRFDAIGFAWKEDGTTCMHLPQTHELIKLAREALQTCAPGCTIITETNVPHKDNISYFGSGHDEAGMVYQFPLPPLTLYSFLSQSAEKLTEWADSLEPTTADTTYFNFLASHDGIGMRPVEDILNQQQKEFMAQSVLERGGQISYRDMPDGSKVPYELNINYLDAVAGDETDIDIIVQKYLASQCVLLSMKGMPAVYYHSLLGSRNSYKDYEESGIKRRINREKLDLSALEQELADEQSLRSKVFNNYKKMIQILKEHGGFSPNSLQQVLFLDKRVFAMLRGQGEILVLINVSGELVELNTEYSGTDLFTNRYWNNKIDLKPYGYYWIKL